MPTPDDRWIRLADGVLARRHAELDLTTGLVLGERTALVIDTGGDRVQGAALAGAVREITDLPLVVAITHAHFDHCFGTAAFTGSPVHAHPACVDAIARTGAEQRDEWVAHYRALTDGRGAGIADALASTEPVLPDHPLPTDGLRLDLGGRAVHLLHPGRGHTDHDLVVHVPDARLLFAGDLVEEGAPPSVGPDSLPAEWPATLDRLLDMPVDLLVPGHGEPLDKPAVMAQREEIAHRRG